MSRELRDKLIQLSVDKKIKHKKAFLQKASEETLQGILKEYEAEQLSEVNAQLTEVLIEKFSALLKEMDLVRDKVKLEQDLDGNDLVKRGVQKVVGYVTPYCSIVKLITYVNIGLISHCMYSCQPV